MAVLLLNVASAFAMTSVIWAVQLIIYPAFRHVPADRWAAYHGQHSRRISWIVGPVMAVELVTGVALVAGAGPAGIPGWQPWAALVATLVAIGMTGAVHSPDHGRLAAGPDPRLIDRLIRLGWIRTAAWTAHGAVAMAMVSALA